MVWYGEHVSGQARVQDVCTRPQTARSNAMSPVRLILVTLLAACAAACATPTVYAPLSDASQGGYAESRIEANRWRVTFSGNTLTSRETVETYLINRAAELTRANGFDHFIITGRATDEKTNRIGSAWPRTAAWPRAGAWYFHPRLGWIPAYDPFADLWDEPYLMRETSRYTASAEVAMFRGPKPADRPDAFDARDVLANLANRITQAPAAPPLGP